MKREALIRELRNRAKAQGLHFKWDPSHGKGSHGTVQYGDRQTTVKSGELPPGYVKLVRKQLGIA